MKMIVFLIGMELREARCYLFHAAFGCPTEELQVEYSMVNKKVFIDRRVNGIFYLSIKGVVGIYVLTCGASLH